LVEMVVNRGVDGDELLQTSRSSEAEHGSLSSSKRQVRILGSIVQPTTCLLAICVADDLHGSAVRPQKISHDDMWSTISFHCFPEEFQCRFAIPALGDIAFKHFALVINGPPEIVGFSVDFYEHLVQMPLPIRMSTKLLNPFLSDLCGKQRAEPVPPKPHRLMADLDPALM